MYISVSTVLVVSPTVPASLVFSGDPRRLLDYPGVLIVDVL